MSDVNEAVHSRDWSNGTVDHSASEPMTAYSVRLPVALLERVFADAEEQGVKPGPVIRQILEKHYEPQGGDVALIHVRQFRSELEEAVAQVVARNTTQFDRTEAA